MAPLAPICYSSKYYFTTKIKAMKLPKTLLQAIAVGLTIGAATATTSCSMFEDSEEIHLTTCEDECTIDHSKKNNNNHTWDCPACGMG